MKSARRRQLLGRGQPRSPTSYLVTNTGNVTLDPVGVTDPMPGLSAVSCPDADPGPDCR